MQKGILKISLPTITSILLVIFAVLSINLNVFAQEATEDAQPTVSPSPTPITFENCQGQTNPGDKSHYDNGLHWIVGGGLLTGSDDVYTIGDDNYMQCYCPLPEDFVDGEEGIQTNWENTHSQSKSQDKPGSFTVWGPDFGLDPYWFYASGSNKPSPTTPNFDCNPTTGESTPSASPSTGGSNNNDSNNNSSVGGATVSTSSAPQVLAATGGWNTVLLMVLGFGMITVGGWQLKSEKRKAKSEKS